MVTSFNTFAGREVRKLAAAAVLFGAALLLLPPAAGAAGGLKPSKAPLVEIGKKYFGTTAAGGGDTQTEYWKLPPLQAQDVVTVAWNDRDATGATRMCLAQDIDDYNFGEHECDEVNSYYTYFGNESYGSARSFLEFPKTSAASFLKFYKRGYTCCGDGGPYDFVIEAIQHRIGASLTTVTEIAQNGTLTGSANLTSGAPVADGMIFTLSARWKDSAKKPLTALYAATSVGGTLTFPLALPASAAGKKVSFLITRPADAQYLAVKSAPLKVPVSKAGPTPEQIAAYRSCLAKARKSARRAFKAARHMRGRGKARAVRQARKAKHRATSRCRRLLAV
jgi:hypothetical protein